MPNERAIFFFNDTATTEIYTLSLHDALPISCWPWCPTSWSPTPPSPTSRAWPTWWPPPRPRPASRSEEHTSELQSQSNLVCRLLLEKKTYFPTFRGSPGEVRASFHSSSHSPR